MLHQLVQQDVLMSISRLRNILALYNFKIARWGEAINRLRNQYCAISKSRNVLGDLKLGTQIDNF